MKKADETPTPPDFTEQQDKDVTGFEAIPLLERAMRTSMHIECDCDRSDYNACHGHCVGSLIWNDIHRARKLLTRQPSGNFTEQARQLVSEWDTELDAVIRANTLQPLIDRIASFAAEAATAALEQAARLVENYHECPSTNDYNIARDIRALKPEAAKERNVSPECWREEHGDCKCSSLICRCGCHRVEIDYFGASTSDAAIGDDKEKQN